MVKAAIADNYKFEVSDVEFHLPKPSYSIYTLAHLREKNPGKEFSLILGEDNLENFTQWKNHEEILNQFSLYVYPRPRVTNSPLKSHAHVKMVDAPLALIYRPPTSDQCVLPTINPFVTSFQKPWNK